MWSDQIVGALSGATEGLSRGRAPVPRAIVLSLCLLANGEKGRTQALDIHLDAEAGAFRRAATAGV